MKKILFTIFLLITLTTFGQGKEERVLYVVDSVEIIEDPKEDEGVLLENDVELLTIVTDKTEIGKFGYKNFDKVIFIITKEYMSRPEEVRRIPTLKKMVKRENKWCLKGSSLPYTGKFIDYYSNGKKYKEGFIKDGIHDSLRVVFYQNGLKKLYVYFVNGMINGDYGEYFINGQLEQNGVFVDGKEEGLWREWYSTGVLKNEINYEKGKPQYSKEQDKYNSLFAKALKSHEMGNYKMAVKYYNKAAEVDSNDCDLYFHRGRAYLYDFQFDKSIVDCDKAIELEPLYMEAYSNRAFVRIRKHEFADSRVLARNSEVSVLAGRNKAEISQSEKEKICCDLKKGFELGDNKKMITDAIKEYCE